MVTVSLEGRNPRKGIETLLSVFVLRPIFNVQKDVILARGLKPVWILYPLDFSSIRRKEPNPRKGIEAISPSLPQPLPVGFVGKELILARGLKR